MTVMKVFARWQSAAGDGIWSGVVEVAFETYHRRISRNGVKLLSVPSSSLAAGGYASLKR
jgi:hypothetical protein